MEPIGLARPRYYDGLRSPFGRHAGALAAVRPDDRVAEGMRALVARNPWPADQIEDVILGAANQAGEDARNVARNALLAAGFPVTVPGQSVNRLCASGLAALMDAARAVTYGEGELFVAGGVESMTRAPFVVAKSESAFGRDFKVFDSTIGARFPNPQVTAQYGGHTMQETGDNVARDFGITRAQSDAFALASQTKYQAALQDGFYAGKLHPISVPTGRKTPPLVVDQDEHPRPETTAATLEKLKPLFEGGVVTAGNASGINDGAAVLLIGSRAAGEKAGKPPMGWHSSSSSAAPTAILKPTPASWAERRGACSASRGGARGPHLPSSRAPGCRHERARTGTFHAGRQVIAPPQTTFREPRLLRQVNTARNARTAGVPGGQSSDAAHLREAAAAAGRRP